MTRLASLTLGFIVAASVLFAAISVSPYDLWAFPVVVSLWTAFAWTLSRRGVEVWSRRPHQPRHVTRIIVACTILSLIALGLCIAVGVALVARLTSARL